MKLPRLVIVVAIATTLQIGLVGLSCSPDDRPPSVLLVIFDTTRADHLSAYGYHRPTTPHLDQLAREGERYTRAYAQAPWTLPSVATILTGQPPHVHGAGRGRDDMFGIRQEVATVAEHLRSAGYRTAAIFNVVWLNPQLSSLDRGFERYDLQTNDDSNRTTRDARKTTDAALSWVREIGPAPFFLAVHYFDPHLTYDPEPPYDTMFEPDGDAGVPRGFGSVDELVGIRRGEIDLTPRQRQSLVARYDGEVRFADDQFGRLRQELEELGRWNDTLVIVVSDHGEEFWDHGGFEHGHTHYAEMLHVPLIVRRPRQAAGVVHDERVRTIDVAPTILALAGLELPAHLPGRPLGDGHSRLALAQGSLWSGDLVSVRTDAGTVILNRNTQVLEVFASSDSLESHPIPAGDEHAALVALLRAVPALRSKADVARVPTPEELRQLKALGYVQ